MRNWEAQLIWEKDLKDRFPIVFETYLEGREIGVDVGWHPIVERLVADLAQMNGHVVQIKEKFGELRVYLAEFNPVWEARVEQAVLEASTTCEVCGVQGEQVTLGNRPGSCWIKTLCENHIAEVVA